MVATVLFSSAMIGRIRCAQCPRPRMTYAGASAIAGNPFAYEPHSFQGAYDFSRKNMDLVGRAFLHVENAAVVLRIVFDHADGEALAQIPRVFRAGNGVAAVLTHSLKACEGYGTEFRLIQDCGVRRRNRLAGVGGGPVIGVLRGAEQRAARAAIRIERGEGAVHHDERDVL